MAEPVWGTLQKALDNSDTIDDAIAAAIAEHEADADAHTGTGESLETHKNQEIVDHPQGSVLGDKFSNQEFALHLTFESLDKYTKTGSGINSDVGGFTLSTGAVNGTETYLYADAQYSNVYYDYDRDTTFQAFVKLTATTNQTVYFMAGGPDADGEPPGVGFKVSNGTLYAVETVFGEEATEEYTTQISGITLTNQNLYRVQVVASENKAYFYVNKVLKATLTLHTNADVGLCLFSFYIINSEAADKQMQVSGVYIAINPI